MNNDNNKSVRRIGFINFFKLSLLYGLAIGQVLGLMCLISGICGSGVEVDFGFWKAENTVAGILCLFLMPLLLGLSAVLFAPVLYLPFAFACSRLGGFKVPNET